MNLDACKSVNVQEPAMATTVQRTMDGRTIDPRNNKELY